MVWSLLRKSELLSDNIEEVMLERGIHVDYSLFIKI